MHPDITAITDIISETAREEILPRFRQLGKGGIRTKTHAGDLVTDADVAAEQVLTKRLTAALPGSVVVGEEAVYRDKSLLDRMVGEAPVWVVDPVDGTHNFAHGHPVFASVVALTKGGETVAGWLHDPVSGATLVAERGGGAWRDGERLAVRGKGKRLKELDGSSGYRRTKSLHGRYRRQIRHGSAAHDYMAIAQGRMHFAVFSRLMPWDHAAGVLLHCEAGGHAALVDGSPYRPTEREGLLVVAPDEGSWAEIAGIVRNDPVLTKRS